MVFFLIFGDVASEVMAEVPTFEHTVGYLGEICDCLFFSNGLGDEPQVGDGDFV